jgi:hypothetical protein
MTSRNTPISDSTKDNFLGEINKNNPILNFVKMLPAAAEISLKTEGERTDIELDRCTRNNRRLS